MQLLAVHRSCAAMEDKIPVSDEKTANSAAALCYQQLAHQQLSHLEYVVAQLHCYFAMAGYAPVAANFAVPQEHDSRMNPNAACFVPRREEDPSVSPVSEPFSTDAETKPTCIRSAKRKYPHHPDGCAELPASEAINAGESPAVRALLHQDLLDGEKKESGCLKLDVDS